MDEKLHRLADLVADIVEADGAHPLDNGFCEKLRERGYTAAERQRLIECWRKMALSAAHQSETVTVEILPE